MILYEICFSLSDFLDSVWHTLGPSAPLCSTVFIDSQILRAGRTLMNHERPTVSFYKQRNWGPERGSDLHPWMTVSHWALKLELESHHSFWRVKSALSMWLSSFHLVLLTELQTISHTWCYILYIAVQTNSPKASHNTRLLCIQWQSTLCLYTCSYTMC